MHRAIETRYNGRRFRSRLEARWAVALNQLDVIWEYEPEGFELGAGMRYLPDFLLWNRDPSHDDARGYWLEIKPSGAPSERDQTRMALLCKATNRIGLIVCGPPDRPQGYGFGWPGGPDGHQTDVWSSEVIGDCMRVSPSAIPRVINFAMSARFEFGENGTRA